LPGDSKEEPAVPPPNALLLMRCRSAPSLNYTDSDIAGCQAEDCSLSNAKKKSPSNAVVLMRCETDFSKLSLEVSKETWVSKRDFTHQTFMRSVSLKGWIFSTEISQLAWCEYLWMFSGLANFSFKESFSKPDIHEECESQNLHFQYWNFTASLMWIPVDVFRRGGFFF